MVIRGFAENQKKIDRLIGKMNRMKLNTEWKAQQTPEFQKKYSRSFKRMTNLKQKQKELLKKRIRSKRFYFKPIKTSTSIYGGRHFKADIFQHTKKGLKNVGTAKWNTASYRGEESEVLNQLVRDKILPKEVLQISKGTHSGSGYWNWPFKDEIGVDIKQI